MEDTELKVGRFTFKGWYIAAALPILSAISGTIYYGYDVVNRFYGVEENIEIVLAVESRVQTLEQAIQDNDVRGLSEKLATLTTNMQTILSQQTQLLDLRSKVEKSETITNSIGDKLDVYDNEIDDIWKAMDELYNNPLK